MEDHEHLSRYQYHRDFGLRLAEVDSLAAHQWSCVVVFYAAYHSARWGLQCDSRFDDIDALKAINPHLMPSDRNTAKHKARKGNGGPDFGVNDLVLLLYPGASRAYEKLHQASIEVRYNHGIQRVLPPAERLEGLLDDVHTAIGMAIWPDTSLASGDDETAAPR